MDRVSPSFSSRKRAQNKSKFAFLEGREYMRYGEFVDLVQKRARLNDWNEAVAAIEATLKTLGERLTEKEAADLAAQLPPAIGRFLTVVDMNKDFDLQAFYKHVSQRLSIVQSVAMEHAQAVMSVVAESVPPGELRDLLSQLPNEFSTLFPLSSDWSKT
jgi:uncharacterized protein (DUF2267 family)